MNLWPRYAVCLPATIGLMLFVGSASGADRLVPGQYSTIAAAVAASSSGDTILVSPGVYNSGFSFGGKQLLVRSTAGSLVTVIDVSATGGTVVAAQSGEPLGTRIEGFSLRAATSSAVVVSGGANLEIANCRIYDSSTSDQRGGAGLFVNSGSVSVSGSTFQNLRASGALMAAVTGGALSVNAGASVEISDCQFVNCSAFQQFGADGSQLGTWSARGGAIWCSSSTVSIARTQFTGCSAVVERTHPGSCWNVGRNGVCESYGGALALDAGAVCTLVECSFSGCTARASNAVQWWITQYEASQQWQAAHAYGGAIASVGGGNIMMSDGAFADCSTSAIMDQLVCGTGFSKCGGNSRRSFGGSVYVDGSGSAASMSSSQDQFLRGNCALGGTCNVSFNWGGSGVMVVPGGSQATLSNARFVNCADRAVRLGAGTAVALLSAVFDGSVSTGLFVDGNAPIVFGGAFRSGAGTPVVVVNAATGPTIADTTFCANATNAVSGPWVDGGGNVFWNACPACASDLDNDGAVSGADLGVMIGAWGVCGAGCRSDLNQDGVVNGLDLGLLLGSWGPCD